MTKSAIDRIYYTDYPGRTSDLLETRLEVAYLQSSERFQDIEFCGIVYSPNRSRNEQLIEIKEHPAVLLWGRGYEHDYSLSFEPKRGFKKLVIDVHQDAKTDDDLRRKIPNSCNHLIFSLKKERCKGVAVIGCDYMRVEGNECITHGARHSNHGLIPDTKRAYFEAMASGRKIAFYSTPFAIEELERENSALKFEKEALHISLDLDGINGFRCHPGYVDRRLKKLDAKTAYDYLIQLMRPERGNRLIRYDIGGLHIDDTDIPLLRRGEIDYHGFMSKYVKSLEMIEKFICIALFGLIVHSRKDKVKFEREFSKIFDREDCTY